MRRKLQAVAIALLAFATHSPAAEPMGALPDIGTRRGGEDWPRFLGPRGDGKSTEKGILTDWRDGKLKIVWRRKLGEGYGIGSVSKGRFFQFDRFGDKARLYCLNAETGKELWQFEYATNYEDLYGYNNGPRTSPVIDGNRVYIHGVEGMLHCVRATDGKLLWKVDTARQFGVVQNFFGAGCTPVVEGKLLILNVGGSPPESRRAPPGALDRVKPNGAGIVAFDKFTGKVRYKAVDELASYASPTLATIGDRRWCFVFARGGLVGFDPKTGKVDFHYPWRAKILESVNAATPVVVGNEVFISETYGPGSSLLKVKPGGYEVVWRDKARDRDKAMQCHWNTPIHHEGYLYGSSGRHMGNAELRCIEWKSGKVKWSIPGLTRCNMLYADGHLITQGERGTLFLLKANPEKFQVVSVADLRDKAGEPLLDYPAWSAPILSRGLLYVRGKSNLVCLELIPQRGAGK